MRRGKPRRLLLRHESSGECFEVLDGRTWLIRLRGLLGVQELGKREGCYLAPCRAIHMLGMRVAIDVIWLDQRGRVLRVDTEVLPGWTIRMCPGAYGALELKAGVAAAIGCKPGDVWHPS